MVPFAGFEMPIQYDRGIVAEHKSVREAVGIFDVSHMGEVEFLGPGAVATVQKLVTNDISKLADWRAMYTVTCRPDGGIVDDCIVYRLGQEHLRIVVNASNVEKDYAHFVEHGAGGCTIENRSDAIALLAVQGPRAPALVSRLCGEQLAGVASFGLGEGSCNGAWVLAARTGYTGEDGFELFVGADEARVVWDAMVGGGAAPIGLGARDTLRLEARLCPYGNDIDETTDPLSAGLGWVVKLDKGDFVGRDALVRIKNAGPKEKLVGFRVNDRGIVRPGAEIVDDEDRPIGRVTSGGPAPTLGYPVGMGWMPPALGEPGRPVRLRQRGKTLLGELVKGPFYKRKA
jgi:aminomethyltransferase